MSVARQVFDALSVHGLKLATAESCTGGLVAAAITDLAGSSAIYDRGFVTYSNAAKVEQLGVAFDLITQFGAVSEEVAIAMAQGALLYSAADIAVSVTGIAGPSGGSELKPVGLVWFALATREETISKVKNFSSLERGVIRKNATDFVLQMVIDQLKEVP
jgi:nicotinamide-nucleotide amidase